MILNSKNLFRFKSTTGNEASNQHDQKKHQQIATAAPHPSSKSGLPIDSLYDFGQPIGEGGNSLVRRANHRYQRKFFCAIKCVDRKALSETGESDLQNEINLLQELKHDNIVRLYDVFTEQDTHYLVMEELIGGDCFDRIVSLGRYSEKEAKLACKNLLQAVQFCHKNCVAHRDLKPENLLLPSKSDNTTLKIADFGYAKKCHQRNSLITECGSPNYVAPEVLGRKPYDERVDMWSVGVVLYVLLSGYTPFNRDKDKDQHNENNNPETSVSYDAILRGEYNFHDDDDDDSRVWDAISNDAKNLISTLLVVDPSTRFNATQALDHPWFNSSSSSHHSNKSNPWFISSSTHSNKSNSLASSSSNHSSSTNLRNRMGLSSMDATAASLFGTFNIRNRKQQQQEGSSNKNNNNTSTTTTTTTMSPHCDGSDGNNWSSSKTKTSSSSNRNNFSIHEMSKKLQTRRKKINENINRTISNVEKQMKSEIEVTNNSSTITNTNTSKGNSGGKSNTTTNDKNNSVSGGSYFVKQMKRQWWKQVKESRTATREVFM